MYSHQSNAARIRSKDTKPEVWLRHRLFDAGYRYRKNVKYISGHPDIWMKNTILLFLCMVVSGIAMKGVGLQVHRKAGSNSGRRNFRKMLIEIIESRKIWKLPVLRCLSCGSVRSSR